MCSLPGDELGRIPYIAHDWRTDGFNALDGLVFRLAPRDLIVSSLLDSVVGVDIRQLLGAKEASGFAWAVTPEIMRPASKSQMLN